MKMNAFIDILINWDKMSRKRKLQRLQDLENMLARFQERKPRTVTDKIDDEIRRLIGEGREFDGYYSRSNKKNICVAKLDGNALDAIKNIIHEGFHAYIDDFVSGKVKTLKLYSKMSKELFEIQEENLEAISSHFRETERMPLFDSFYIEERVNYKENSMYMTKMIIDAIENPIDAMKLTEAFIFSLMYYCDNERRGKKLEREYGSTYDEMVTEALNVDGYEKDKVAKDGVVRDNIDPEFAEFFEKACKYYQQYADASYNPIMRPDAKREEEAKALDKLNSLYRDYVLTLLRKKHLI